MKTSIKGLLAAAVATATLGGAAATADEARVVDARATLTSVVDGVEFWRFDVTVEHADEGWDHYADAFEILSEDGAVLGVRTLYHPHVEEQPFTRSISNVEIPPSVERVIIRAHDNVHGYGEAQMELILERPEG